MLMKAVVMPGFSQLIVVIDPTREVTRQGLISVVMPWLYAPWPEAKEKGISETQIEGATLRALLFGLAARYKAANVDFQPVNTVTGDLDFDYDVSVNGASYLSLDGGLDTKLQTDDTVKIDMLWRWDG
jgi:hypothetical protein